MVPVQARLARLSVGSAKLAKSILDDLLVSNEGGKNDYDWRHKIVRRSYDKDQDTFRHYFLVLPCLLLALLIHEKFTVKELLWTFSIYLEAVAILPQLVLLQRTRNIDNLTGQYVFLLGNAADLDSLQPLLKKCNQFLETEVVPSSVETSRPRTSSNTKRSQNQQWLNYCFRRAARMTQVVLLYTQWSMWKLSN